MVEIYCEGCDEYFKVEKFEKGVTKCPSCGLQSLLKEVAKKVESPPATVEKTSKPFYVCPPCKLSWSNLEMKKCPKCKSSKLQIEYRMV